MDDGLVDRARWADSLATSVWERAIPKRHRSAAQRLLAMEVTSPLARALVVVTIAYLDDVALSEEEIAKDLQRRGLVMGDALDDLVRPCLRSYRGEGAFWPRYWDLSGLRLLLLELRAAECTRSRDVDAMRAEMAEVWGIPSQMAELLDATLDEVPTLSIRDSTVLPNFAARLGGADHKPSPPRLDLADVPHLQTLVWEMEAGITVIGEEDGGGEGERWWRSLQQDLLRLTVFESSRLKPPREDEATMARLLEPGNRVFHAPLMAPDALPTGADAGKIAPEWMREVILHRGAHTWHHRLSPWSVWLVTASSASQERHFVATVTAGQVGFRSVIEGDRVELTLHFDWEAEDGGLSASFFYGLDTASEAWEVLHLTATARVRVTFLSAREDEELRVLTTATVPLSQEVVTELAGAALDRLRILVGDDESRLVEAVWALPTAYESDGTRFVMLDGAKAEDLVLDVDPDLDGSPPWEAYRKARIVLARHRSKLAQEIVDGEPHTGSLAAVRGAEEAAHHALEVAHGKAPRRSSGSLDERLSALADKLPNPDSAFVHLHEQDGYLGAAWLGVREGEPVVGHVDLSAVPFAAVRSTLVAWSRSSRHGSLHGRSWDDVLDMVVEFLAEVMKPLITEVAHLGARHLLISPIAPLDLLPLHVAPVDGLTVDALFDDVAYVPSLAFAAAIKGRTRMQHDANPLLVAHSGRGHAPPVRGPEAEVKLLTELYGDADALVEEAATPQAVLSAARRRPFVHIASHARTERDRWASGSILEGETLGRATLSSSLVCAEAEVWDSDLVVLTGCRTGAHEVDLLVRETMRGIDAAFLSRGARCVVSTLWEVWDVTATTYAALLHAHLLAGQTVGRAHASATGALRDGFWRLLPETDGPIAVARQGLDRKWPGWKSTLDQERADHVSGWGAFKVSGVTWLEART